MAIEAGDRHHPARWLVLGPALFAGLLSVGLALLVVAAPAWEPTWGPVDRAAGSPELRPSDSGPQSAGQRFDPPPRAVLATPGASATGIAPIGAGRPGTGYRPAPAGHRHPDGYHRSLLFSGIIGLAIAIVGATMIGRRRQMW